MCVLVAVIVFIFSEKIVFETFISDLLNTNMTQVFFLLLLLQVRYDTAT